jgi:hypothetical protein
VRLYQGNPRTISRKEFTDLHDSLDELGDLGGLVHDLNSDQVISGNQRTTVFDLAKIKPVITEELDEPNAQGTVARGYIEWHGERFAYRAVRWTEEQCRKANIKANLSGGGWNFDELAGWNTEDLQAWGFNAEKLARWNGDAANLATMLGVENEAPDFQEYDESIADGVSVCKCPTCGHEHAKKD